MKTVRDNADLSRFELEARVASHLRTAAARRRGHASQAWTRGAPEPTTGLCLEWLGYRRRVGESLPGWRASSSRLCRKLGPKDEEVAAAGR